MYPKYLAASALAFAVVAALAPTAAHADPVGLPVTDSLFTMECDSGPSSSVAPLQLFSVNAGTGALTTVGSGDAGTPDGDNCAGRAAADPTSGRVYFVDYAHDPDSLSYIDPTTGITTVVGGFARADAPDAMFTVWALAIDSSGSVFATDGTAIFTVDLETAELTLVGDGTSGASGTVNVLAAHPVTGQLYGLTSNAAPSTIYAISSTTGEATVLAEITQRYVYGFAFDSSGWAWVTRYDPSSSETRLGTVDVNDWNATYSDVAPLRLEGSPDYDYYVESLFITSTAWSDTPDNDSDGSAGGDTGGPGDGDTADSGTDTPGGEAPRAAAPELAETGADSVLTGRLLGAAILALLGGAGLVVAQRRRQLQR